MPITDDRNDPRLSHGVDTEPGKMAEVYLVLSDEERAKGFIRPFRDTYRHVECTINKIGVTHMGRALSETYARKPDFYGATFCVYCSMHRPVGEFVWDVDNEIVGS